MLPTKNRNRSLYVAVAFVLVNLMSAILLPPGCMSATGSSDHSKSGSISFAKDQPLSLHRWSTNGPDGGAVVSLAVDQSNPATIYAATANGVFKSTNRGESWVSSLAISDVRRIAISPTSSPTVYVAGHGIYKSIDGGSTWKAINHGLENQFGPVNLLALAIDPSNANIVYAAGPDVTDPSVTYKAIYETLDGGENWVITKYSIRSFAIHLALAIDPVNPNTVYAGGSVGNGTVWKSTDGGYFWTIVNVGVDYRSTVLALVIDPTNTNILYAGTTSLGIYKSIDGGVTWNAFSDGLPYYEYNGQQTFSSVNSIVIDPLTPSTVYAATYNGVFKTSGGSWSALNAGLTNLGINTLAMVPGSPSTFCAGTYSGVFRSINNGASWSLTNNGLRGAAVGSLSINPGNADVYAGVDAFAARSSDNGASWISTKFYPLAFDPHQSNIIYGRVGDTDHLFKSINGGASWRDIHPGRADSYAGFAVVDPGNSNVIYAATDGIYKSLDAGETWRTVTSVPSFYPYSLVIDPRNSNTLYAIFDDGNVVNLFKSVDGAATWKILAHDEKLFFYYVYWLVIDPVNTSNLYVNGCDSRANFCAVYKSADGGDTWNIINGDLPVDEISSLVIDPVHPNVLYAGSYNNHGVLKSEDGGASWKAFNDGLINLSVNALAIDPGAVFLHAATSSGVFDIQLTELKPSLIDDTQFFVRQHYRDFLNREADPDGLNFWTGEIFMCGSNPQCIEAKRINDSASFFLSIEFQQTGYLVYRMYKASYGNLPNAPVPIKLAEFLPDTQEIGKNVIVNQAGWEQTLENNKQAFAAAFVQRQRFVSAYPTSLSPDAFVDALFTNTGVTPSSADRSAALAEFGGVSNTGDVAARARALRRVAENSTLAKQEFNRAFVLMQYFGYLRRNPNDAPEATLDFQGYNFWLNKLNSFNGNFIAAEMVKAFLSSSEYRQRFGP